VSPSRAQLGAPLMGQMADPSADRQRARRLEQLLSAKEIVVTCGAGGVGKTTVAAALAATAASRLDARVLVLTVDPARRLADALGIGALGNAVRRIPNEAFEKAGLRPRGALYAAMLDMGESWDALISRHAPDSKTAEEIIANPLYRNVTRRFAHGHDYIAMERLYELHEAGDYDLVIVDTPPSRHALDLLDAPQNVSEFFSSRLLRWLVVPYRSRLVNLASRPFYQVADRILGSQFLEDLAEFFILLQTMRDGFMARAQAVSSLLRDVRTTFVVVTTLEAVPAGEANRLTVSLLERHMHLGLLVCNKVLPASLSDPTVAKTAELLAEEARAVSKSLAHGLALDGTMASPASADTLGTVLEEVARSFANFRSVALREAELLGELSVAHELTATVPYHPGQVTDLAGLCDVGSKIWGDEPPVVPSSGAGSHAKRASRLSPSIPARSSHTAKRAQPKAPESSGLPTKATEADAPSGGRDGQ